MGKSDTEELLTRYRQAWRDHDPESIVGMMTPDAVYEASYGPKPWGERYVGREAILEGVRKYFAEQPTLGARLQQSEQHVFGNHAVSVWTSHYRDASGSEFAINGCDIYEFEDGLVSSKIAYRKSAVAEYHEVE